MATRKTMRRQTTMKTTMLILAALVGGCASNPVDCNSEGAKRSGAACVTTDDCCVDYAAASKDPTTALVCSSVRDMGVLAGKLRI